MPDINIPTQITDWNVGDILAGSAPGRSARIPGSVSTDLKVLAQQGDGKKSAKPFWTSVGSIIPGLAAIATSGSASDLIAGTIPPLRFPALTGDVTTPVGSLATTISPNAVSNGKLAKMPPMTIKGNNSILAADPKDLTVAEVNAMGIGGGGGGSGTVTSVGLSLPAIFSVAGSPITTAGTFSVTLATELPNTVWAGPTTGAAATPTFRGLVIADIPSLSTLYQPIDATLTALSALADSLGFLHNNGSGTLAWSTAVVPGAITTSGLTQATARILGRTTAATGAIEEITIGSGLTLAAGSLTATGGGTGDFVGPASATDNAVVRFDGTTGKLGQNSLFIIDDSGNVSDGGTLPASTALYFERSGFCIATLNSTAAESRLRMKRADTLNSVWLEFQRNDASNEWLLGVPNSGVIAGGNTFAIDYYDGTTEFPFLQLSNAGALRLPSYTTAGLLTNDTSGNVTTATVGTGLSLSAGVLSATGGGSGTVNSGTATQLAYYASTGTAVSSTPAFTIGASGNPAITASGSNQSIVFTPSGTGEVKVNTNNSGSGSITFHALNSANAGRSTFTCENDSAATATFGVYGSAFAITGFRNNSVFGADNSLLVITNGATSTGGTSPFDIITGGYSNNPTVRVVAGSPGRMLVGSMTDDAATLIQAKDASMTNPIRVGSGGAGITAYGLLSFNAVRTLAGTLGMLGGASGDDKILYFAAPSTGQFQFFINGSTVGAWDGNGLKTSNPTSGTAAAWRLGSLQTNYAEADIAGTAVQLARSTRVLLPLFNNFADAGNSTTTETDLVSNTIAASQLGTNGDKLELESGGVFVSSATATREIKLYFGGTAIFDTGTLTLSLSAAWSLFCQIMRVSATVVRYNVSFTTEGAALSAYTAVGELTGLTLSSTNVLKTTGQAAGVGAATNDIVSKISSVNFIPAA